MIDSSWRGFGGDGLGSCATVTAVKTHRHGDIGPKLKPKMEGPMRERADVLTGLFMLVGVTVESKRQSNYRGVDVGAVTGDGTGK